MLIVAEVIRRLVTSDGHFDKWDMAIYVAFWRLKW